MEWVNEIAYQPPEAIVALNTRLLQQHIRYCFEHSPFYRRRFKELGVTPGDMRGLESLRALPLTAKADLESHNHDFLAVPESRIVDVCQTSGTTGKPVIMMQTAQDLDRLGYNEEISFRMAGMVQEDRVLIACALGRCFMAGLAYFEGVRRIGAMAIRTGADSPVFLADAVIRHHPTVIVAVPSLAVALAGRLREMGYAPEELGVRMCICIGEPVLAPDLSRSALGNRVGTLWGAQVMGTYASTEMATSFPDCQAGHGGHVHPELIVVEILDDDGKPVAPGTPGEVVATPLQVTGMPLLRLCTGDVAALYEEPCSCGRNTARLGPILGRKQHMLKIQGTTVYPQAIFDVLQEIPGVRNYYLEVFNDYDLSDRILVTVGVSPDTPLPEDFIRERIRGRIRLKAEVRIQEPEEVERHTMKEGSRKTKRFFDNRTNKGTPVSHE